MVPGTSLILFDVNRDFAIESKLKLQFGKAVTLNSCG